MVEEKAYGKINLALRIVRRRNDGYHDIDTVFQSIGLCDTVRILPAEDIQVTCSIPDLPCDETNLAWRAAAALRAYTGIQQGAHIHLDKRIPLAAGLAGGSADCAAVLRGLNRLWLLRLTAAELMELGGTLGSDVPFCISGGTSRGRGRGEILVPLESRLVCPVLIVHPHIAVHTGQAYSLFDAAPTHTDVDVDAMAAAVSKDSLEDVQPYLANTFEELVIPAHPEISHCRNVLQALGTKPLMSGSGPTMFALVRPEQVQAGLVDKVQAKLYDADIFLSHTITERQMI